MVARNSVRIVARLHRHMSSHSQWAAIVCVRKVAIALFTPKRVVGLIRHIAEHPVASRDTLEIVSARMVAQQYGDRRREGHCR